MRTVLAGVALAFVGLSLQAQPMPVAPPAPVALPPGQITPPTFEPPLLNGGKDVSRPLSPVGAAPVEAAPVVVPKPNAEPPKAEPAPELPKLDPDLDTLPRARGPLGPHWGTNELLYWWPTRHPIPALVVGTRNGSAPILGTEGTSVLVGNRALDIEPHAGGRFVTGSSLNHAETFGYEIAYFFLGTRSYRERISDLNTRVQSFGLPYTNAVTGANETLLLAQPGMTNSALMASTSTRVQGWEVNTVANVVNEKHVKIHAIAGWRYFQVHEGLRIEQTQFRYADMPGVTRTADQFDAHNRFHGGQLGLHADFRRGLVFCEMTAKIAFGQNYEVVKNEGMTHLLTPGAGVANMRSFGGSGLYVQPSNFGRTANGVFAVVPEGLVKFGLRLGDSGRLYVGYNFIYLSDAVRPGDQIDRTLNPAQIPLLTGTGPVFNADRPARIVNRSDFWAQGLVIGLETRY
jgi:hypothetical protein